MDNVSSYLNTVAVPNTTGEWADQLHAGLAALTAALRPHPAVVALTQSRVLASEPGLAVAERALALLDEAGFTAEQAAEIGSYLINAIVTLVTAEPGRNRGDSAVRQQRARLGALSPEHFPHVVAAADALSTCQDDDAYYSRGLTLLVAGVQGLADTPHMFDHPRGECASAGH